jgi:Fungal specific transcription factor domain
VTLFYSNFCPPSRAGQVPPVLILAVCAVSARFSTHPQIVHDPPFLAGGCFAQPATDIVLKRYNETNLTLLIVLVLLCLHEFGTCQGGSSWMLAGMAIRMGYTLQLHREVFLDPIKNKQFDKLSTTDKEVRRRAIWACFMVDGFTSSGSERPMFISEGDIEVQLPIKEQHFLMEVPGPTESLDGRHLMSAREPQQDDGAPVMDPKSNMGSGAYMVRILSIWRRVTRYLNLGGKERDPHPIWSPDSQFQVLRDQLAMFKKSLPGTLLYTRENLNAHAADRIANQFFFVHIAYHQTVLFLHRYAIPTMPGARTLKAMPMQFVKDSALITLSAAKAISTIINDSSDYFVVAPFIGYSVFTSSTVHIIGTFSKNAALEASSKSYLAYNLKYLTKMKRHWGTFQFMVENLKELYQKHADFARNGGSQATEEGSNDSPEILNYGDWFTVTPRGVSVTAFEDPAEMPAIGNEASVNQKLDLPIVDEFFASFSAAKSKVQQQQSHQEPSKQPGGSGWPQSVNQTSHPTMRATGDSTQKYPPLLPRPQLQQLPTDIPVCGVSIPSTSPTSTLNAPFLAGPIYQPPLQPPSFLPQHIYAPMNTNPWTTIESSADFMSEMRSHWHIPYNMTPPGAEPADATLSTDFIAGAGAGAYSPLGDAGKMRRGGGM